MRHPPGSSERFLMECNSNSNREKTKKKAWIRREENGTSPSETEKGRDGNESTGPLSETARLASARLFLHVPCMVNDLQFHSKACCCE